MEKILRLFKQTASTLLVRLFGHGCRFSPTCSEYFVLACKKHGILYGIWLATLRFLRCHPFSKSSYYDPVK